MYLISKLKVVFIKHFTEMRWHNVFLGVAFYIGICWVLLKLAGEHALTGNLDFIYWLMVTASTVGYGDLSPSTSSGKLITSFIVIPFGLGFFGLVIGRVAGFISFQWRKRIRGLSTLNYSGHILVVGWNENRTLQLMKLLLSEVNSSSANQKIALCVKAEIENPLPEQIGFIRVSSFTDEESMERASINKASCIIIDNPDDDMTMTACLYSAKQNPSAHIIAYFKDMNLGKLLKTHCPNVECMPSVAVEMMAKSAVDPGSSALHHQLLNVDSGMTQYSMSYAGDKELKVAVLFNRMKNLYDATLIAVLAPGAGELVINPNLEMTVTAGTSLFYISDERITNIDWTQFYV